MIALFVCLVLLVSDVFSNNVYTPPSAAKNIKQKTTTMAIIASSFPYS